VTETRSGYQVFSKGLEHITNETAFREAMSNIVEGTLNKIFELQDKGLLEWRRIGRSMDMFTTNIYPVKMHDGSYENVSVYLVV